MTFDSLQALLEAQLEEIDREYADVSNLEHEKAQEIRATEYANWVEINRDFWFQRDIRQALEHVEKLNATIQDIVDAGLPLPHTRFAYSEKGTALAAPLRAQLQHFDQLQKTFLKLKETHGVYRSINDDCILLTIRHIWNQNDGIVENVTEQVLMPVWTTLQLTLRLATYKSELLKTDVPKPAAPRKRIKLLEEERIWRMNYYLRVYFGNIPKRNAPGDKSAYQALHDLWTRNETPTKEQTKAIKEWDALQEQRRKEDGESPKSSRARAVRGQWFVVRFNPLYGLLYNEEVDGPDYENDYGLAQVRTNYHKMVEILDKTQLMYPVTENALPPAIEIDEKEAEKWQRLCPPWMISWSHKLVKRERQSFIMF